MTVPHADFLEYLKDAEQRVSAARHAVSEILSVFRDNQGTPQSGNVTEHSIASVPSKDRIRLEHEMNRLQDAYDVLCKRIGAADKEIGRALDAVQRQIQEERRAEWLEERDRTLAQMRSIEESLDQME